MPIKRGKTLKNYTEYFFDIVDYIDSIKPNNKIKTLGIGKCYYNIDNEFILYKNKKIEILNGICLGGEFDKERNYYNRSERHPSLIEKAKNTTLILSRVGEHLFDFHYQIEDIYKSGIADSFIMLLPDMSKIISNMKNNIEVCKTSNCLNFNLERDIIELSSCTESDILDLHSVYTSPSTIKTLLQPCLSKGMFKNLEIIDCDYYINGYEHFLIFAEFKNKYKSNSYTSKFDFRKNDLINNGIYIIDGNLVEKLDDVTENNVMIEYLFENYLHSKNYDTIVFNKVLSKYSDSIDIVYYLYSICKYIRPGTELLIIEDDMLSMCDDIESDNEKIINFDSFWFLNSLLFGPQYMDVPSDYPYINFCNEFFTNSDIVDILMTQENLYELVNDNHHKSFPFANYNKYTFQRLYRRI